MFKSFMWLSVNRTDVTIIHGSFMIFVLCPCYSSITKVII